MRLSPAMCNMLGQAYFPGSYQVPESGSGRRTYKALLKRGMVKQLDEDGTVRPTKTGVDYLMWSDYFEEVNDAWPEDEVDDYPDEDYEEGYDEDYYDPAEHDEPLDDHDPAEEHYLAGDEPDECWEDPETLD